MTTVVVGAGIAGLAAATRLQAAGHHVIVLDKGRGVGGRLATRRIGAATVDHGAQFFTVRTDEFDRFLAPLRADDVVFQWSSGFPQSWPIASDASSVDGYPRFAARGGMAAIAKHLARGIDVRTDTLVFAVRPGHEVDGVTTRWAVALDDGSHIAADRVVVTCPLPQAFSLLVAAEVNLPEALWRTEYDRTLALLVVLDRSSQVGVPGGVQGAEGFTFVADNALKGVSAVPALTLHFDPAFSEQQWDAPRDDVRLSMLAAAQPFIGPAQVVASEVKRWRFATPRTIWPDRYWCCEDRTLAVAGDAFAGPRVEGAALSGLAAADALIG